MKLTAALLLLAAAVSSTSADKTDNNLRQHNKQRKLQTEYPESFTMGSTLDTPNCTASEACYETEKETIARAIQAELDAAEAAAGVSRRLDSTSENNYYPHEYYGSANSLGRDAIGW